MPLHTERSDQSANLGLATTHELIQELAARADVSKTIGEAWPNYRTVGDEEPTQEQLLARTEVPGQLSLFE
jgi:hypothetical protein